MTTRPALPGEGNTIGPHMILADFLGLDIDPAVGAALVAAAAGALLAGLRAIGLVASGTRGRQRALYSEAYKAAMAWREMLYRVRRRLDGENADATLIDRFHSLQEEIDYFEGWIASESPWMKRSYCRLVREVKTETKQLIHDAWCEPERRHPAEGVRDDDVHPDLSDARDRFLTDVRLHLSLWLVPKLVVVWRNRTMFGGEG